MANSRSLQGYRAVISLAKLDELVADFGIAPAHVSAVAFVILMLSGFSAPRCEATVYDSDGSVASVRALHNIAHDGDTITLPAGTFTWTSALNVTKGITLRGQTTVDRAGTAVPVVNDQTIILDDTQPRGINSTIIRATLSTSSQSFRLTGVTFRFGTVTEVGNGNGAVRLVANAENRNIRLDHCHFDQLYQTRGVAINGWNEGVADHNVFKGRPGIGGLDPFIIHSGRYGNDPEGQGHGSFADYPRYGSDRFFFIEDNTMDNFGSATDTGSGARFVYRHNYNINTGVTTHGTEGGVGRGNRVAEVYDNTFSFSSTHGPEIGLRSGTILVHDNVSIGGTQPNSVICVFSNYRETYIRPNPIWGIADGTCVWDANDTEGDGTFIEGHSPYLFDSGAATATSPEGTLTDTSKHWTVNQWAGYSIKNPNASAAYASFIISNTATTITYFNGTGGGGGGYHLIFNAGDTYQIHRLVTMMDMCGSGKSDLIHGSPPINTTTNRASYAHSVIEPCYSWNNVHSPDGTVLQFAAVPALGRATKLGVHYFNLGAGLPADSTPPEVSQRYNAALNGVAYTGTFTYPHPLVSGAPTPTPRATPRSHQHVEKKKKNSKKLKRRNWPKKIGD
jgi:hypothetical protein